MITAVTSILSTSAILVDGTGLDRDWTARFHRNIHDDSVKLAEASRSLVHYLEAPEGEAGSALSPQDAVARYLDAIGHHVPALEKGEDGVEGALAEAVARVPALGGAAARHMLGQWMMRYRADAMALPLESFELMARATDYDPVQIARRCGVDPAQVMRRLSTLPVAGGHPPLGLAICDGAGALMQMRRVPGFAFPRVAAGCPLWPIYAALQQPGRGIAEVVALPGTKAALFRAWAVAGPRDGTAFDARPLIEATMLVRPIEVADPAAADAARPAGLSCRICPRDGCAARREPSVVAGARSTGTGSAV